MTKYNYDQIANVFKQTQSREKTAKIIGCCESTVSYALRRVGVLSYQPKQQIKVGDTFGCWKILSTKKKVDHKKNYYETYCECICICGIIKLVNKKSLLRGHSTSCGCVNRSGNKSHNWKGHEEIGRQYWNRLKSSAKIRHIHFEITIEEAWHLYIQQNKRCALSDLPISFKKSRPDLKHQTASLDRIDSSCHYILNNVQWVHKDINIMKQSYTQDHFIKLCDAVSRTNK